MTESATTQLADFAGWLKRRHNLADSSIKTYCSDVLAWQSSGLDVEHWLVTGEPSDSRYNMRLAALRKWHEYNDLPKLEIKGRKIRKRTIRYFDEAQVQAWLDELLKAGVREYAAGVLMWGTGIRRKELLEARLEDLDLEHGTLKVIRKGGNEDVVPIAEYVATALTLYLRQVRPNLERPGSPGLLFLGDLGGKYRPAVLTRAVRAAAVRAGLPGKRIKRPNHQFRHACATHMLERGAHTRVVQELLGHASEKMTMQYMTVSPKMKHREYNRHHPLGSKRSFDQREVKSG